MKGYTKGTLISLVCALACVGGYIFDISTNLIIPAAAAVFFSIVFLCFLAVTISRKISADISPYRVFAIADGLISLCVIGYAVYDIVTDTAFFAGIVGVMLLVIIVPTTVFLLLADFLVWKRNCSSHSNN